MIETTGEPCGRAVTRHPPVDGTSDSSVAAASHPYVAKAGGKATEQRIVRQLCHACPRHVAPHGLDEEDRPGTVASVDLGDLGRKHPDGFVAVDEPDDDRLLHLGRFRSRCSRHAHCDGELVPCGPCVLLQRAEQTSVIGELASGDPNDRFEVLITFTDPPQDAEPDDDRPSFTFSDPRNRSRPTSWRTGSTSVDEW
jgi:hypothetical protein